MGSGREREVILVADEEECEVWACEGAGVGKEGGEGGEARMGGDVVDQQGTGGAAVVAARHAAEAFLAGCIPELELDSFPARSRTDFDDLGRELDADGLRGEDAP